MIKNKRRLYLISIDIIIYIVIFLCATIFSAFVNETNEIIYKNDIFCHVVLLASSLGVRFILGAYSNVWRYANSRAYLQMIFSDVSALVISIAIIYSFDFYERSFWRLATVVSLYSLLSLVSRFIYQQYYRKVNLKYVDMNKIGAVIVGAGQIGAMLCEELTYNPTSHYSPLFFIDKDPIKIGSRIHGLKVIAEEESVIEKIKESPVQEIIIAIPSLTSEEAMKMRDFYAKTGCKVKVYDFPVGQENADPKNAKRVLREFNIEDLLFRDSLSFSTNLMEEYYKDKTVLITGGGGSIGSELSRQVARLSPKKLIIVDIYENNAYDIQQELVRKYGQKLDLSVEIASVRDYDRIDKIFDFYRPDVVLHAAAHKHVPLMEHSSGEAIKNNVFGTYNVASIAEKYEVSKFILISTDKAVNPTNVMGASKRLCEMIVQSRSGSKTSFSAVRFGNVLGSNGSVIPLFKRQIANGGPVTITDKRIIRYFMTIPEASQLVMTAGAMAKSGELFVLDMGKPVRILELAENMIKLSGFEPYVDIDIKEIGLRPGEKLYEELLIKTEKLTKTDNNMIFIENDIPLARDEVDSMIGKMKKIVGENGNDIEPQEIVSLIKEFVPTYKDPNEVNKTAGDSDEMKAVECALEK